MKTVVPSYYGQFSCIADRCKHNCCIGWEIDIDNDTCRKYFAIKGDFGERLRDNIDTNEEPCFILGNSERCPFLNDGNLCDIIITLGEDGLCDICREHPRFSNYFSNRTEKGLGLCCEAAAELILNYKDKVQLIEVGENKKYLLQEEKALLKDRQQIFNIIQDRSIGIADRVENLKHRYGIKLPEYSVSQWADIYLSFEQLDPFWTERLRILKEDELQERKTDDVVIEQLLVYFIYRHYSKAIDDGMFEERISFAVISTYIICLIAQICEIDIVEAARSYSAEIEYSEENTQQLLEVLGR